jgi:hypothetical protein
VRWLGNRGEGEGVDTDIAGNIQRRTIDQRLIPNWKYNNYSRRAYMLNMKPAAPYTANRPTNILISKAITNRITSLYPLHLILPAQNHTCADILRFVIINNVLFNHSMPTLFILFLYVRPQSGHDDFTWHSTSRWNDAQVYLQRS